MKKGIFILLFILFFTGCGNKEIVGFDFVDNNGNTYEFFENGTCKKLMNGTSYSCTYTKNGGVVDISLSNGTIESGQINSDCIIIGSNKYDKQ